VINLSRTGPLSRACRTRAPNLVTRRTAFQFRGQLISHALHPHAAWRFSRAKERPEETEGPASNLARGSISIQAFAWNSNSLEPGAPRFDLSSASRTTLVGQFPACAHFHIDISAVVSRRFSVGQVWPFPSSLPLRSPSALPQPLPSLSQSSFPL